MSSAHTIGFSADRLQGELRTSRFGRAAEVVAETASTIELAWGLLRGGGPEGAVVIAERQTQGRGRLGRPWASPAGGLWLSMIARPDMEASAAGRLGIGLGLAAAEAVMAETGCDAGVKWPNDVMVSGRKLGGVLVETEVTGDRVTGAVLSLGLNVNVSAAALPEEIRSTATSLREQTGREWPVEVICARVLERLEEMWPIVLGNGAALVERWGARDVLAGKEVSLEVRGVMVRGRAEGLDSDGGLRLSVAGAVQRVTSGEVAEIRGVAA